MNNPYREKADHVNTEVEIAKIQAKEETKRHSSEQWTKRMQTPLDFYQSGDMAKMIALLGFLAPVITGCVITIMYFNHLWFR